MRILRSIWRGLDRVRRVVHLVLMLVIVLGALAALAPDTPLVPGRAALVLAPEGVLVDQLSGNSFDRALARAQGIAVNETLLKGLVDALREAKDDERIEALVLELDGLSAAGLSKLEELAEEIVAFKESGKPVIAVGDAFSETQYYLAAQADEIFMHPLGSVYVDGYSRYLPYYKSALDALYVDYNVWTVGEYKSFPEPMTRDDMSPEDREASEAYLSELWSAYQQRVTSARGLDEDSLQRYADEALALLRGAGGDAGQLAVDYGLVDELMTRDAMRSHLVELVGEAPPRSIGGDYARVDHDDYLAAFGTRDAGRGQDGKIGVIVASGAILDGVQPPGSVGGESTARLIRQAAADEEIKSLVLRVDSPGGSAFASELILREIEVFQESGRPVVVSMGSVAASGGYWISMTADEIWASPTTLTGSIGVGAMIPTFQRTLDRIGIHVDGVGTTELSGQSDILLGLGDDYKGIVDESVRYIYDEFISKVAEHRGKSIEEVDRVARGVVWVGSQAHAHGLVDELGDLDDAIRSAAELGGLAEDGYAIEYFDPTLNLFDRLLLDVMRTAAPAIAALGYEARLPRSLATLLEAASEPLAFIERFNDPRGIYAYCFCDVR